MKLPFITGRLMLLLSFPILLLSCENEFMPGISGEGDMVRGSLMINYFDSFINTISADIVLTKGQEQEINITGQQNIIDNIISEVTDSVLTISYKDWVRHAQPVTIYITMPELRKIDISGSGDITSTNYFDKLRNLDVIISGSGDIDLSLKADSLNIDIPGSGDISLEGEALKMDITISGSGDVHAQAFQSNEAYVDISGSGELHLNVTDYLNIAISGSGDVYYIGYPDIDSRITGSGRIIDDN